MTDAVLEVSQLNEYVSLLLHNDPVLHALRVQGEISGFKRHTSGHFYFSLKDESALVRCVMFRSQAMQLDFRPADGMHVVLSGYASLYARDGAFQLYAQSLEQCGAGALYLQFLKLKERLEQAGYFDAARKRAIPVLPRAVGVVTSGSGAALQDILQIVARRFPRMSVVLAPVKVQGAGAAEEIAAAIAEMNAKRACDVLIIGRGGGSIEDLWAFNEMPVIDAVYHSAIPVISAVGHETDFTITDFVADLRAHTPSAAAELAVPEWNGCVEAVTDYARRLRYGLTGTLTQARSRVKLLASSRAFSVPLECIHTGRQRVDVATEHAARAVQERLTDHRSTLALAQGRLETLSPLAVLQRGYAVVRDEAGKPFTSVQNLRPKQRVRLTLSDGSAEASIIDIVPKGE